MSLQHQESRNASSHPNRATPLASAPLPAFVQQQLQSMAVVMTDLTHQNQELTQEVNKHKQRCQHHTEGPGQNSKAREVENNAKGEDQSKGTITCRVPRLEKEMDQMKKAMEEMRDSMRRTNHVDDLIHRTDSPFTASITSHPLPSKFKMPTLDSYNGTQDPCNHITTFKTTTHLQGVLDEIMCKASSRAKQGPDPPD